MGYRERLAKVPKSVSKEFREIESYQELQEKLGLNSDPDDPQSFIGFDNNHKTQELLYLCTEVPNDDLVEDFFKNFNIEECAETRYQVMTKAALKQLIEKYEDEIIEMMDTKLKIAEEDALVSFGDFAYSDLKLKREYWRSTYSPRITCAKPYILKEEGKDIEKRDGQIAALPFMEYQIFNVVFIYNTFDWENYDLIVSGW